MQIMMMIDDEEEDDDEDEDEDHDDGEEEDQVYKRMTHSGVWLNVKSSCPWKIIFERSWKMNDENVGEPAGSFICIWDWHPLGEIPFDSGEIHI